MPAAKHNNHGSIARSSELTFLKSFGGGIATLKPLIFQNHQLFVAVFGYQIRVFSLTSGTPGLIRAISLYQHNKLSHSDLALLESANEIYNAKKIENDDLIPDSSKPLQRLYKDSILSLQYNPRDDSQVFVLPSSSSSFMLYNIQTGKRSKTYSLPKIKNKYLDLPDGKAVLSLQIITNLKVISTDSDHVYITVREIYTNNEDSTEISADLYVLYRYTLTTSDLVPLGTTSIIAGAELDSSSIISAQDPIITFSISDDKRKIVIGRTNYIEAIEYNNDISDDNEKNDETNNLIIRSEVKLLLNPGNLSEVVTCVEIQPDGNAVAVGSSIGKIHLCHVFNVKLNALTSGKIIDGNSAEHGIFKSALHWHPSRVNSLTFSNDGQQLLSGGKESVLVIWQVQNRQKKFIPRLGGELFSVGYLPDQKSYVVSLRNGTIHFISTHNSKIWATLTSANIDDAFDDELTNKNSEQKIKSPLISSANGLVLLKERAGLSLLDASSSTADLLAAERISLVSRIYTANADQQKDTPIGKVSHALATLDGQWILSIEKYTNPTVDDTIKKHFKKDIDLPWSLNSQRQNIVKFWNATYNKGQVDTKYSNDSYSLNSLVNETANVNGFITTAAITQMKGAKDVIYSAATGYFNGTFKIWHYRIPQQEVESFNDDEFVNGLSKPKSTDNGSGRWSCEIQGKFKEGSKPTISAFSQDGTILAIGFTKTLTLWSTLTGQIIDTYEQRENIANVIFLENGRIVILLENGSILVIDLIIKSTLWEICGKFNFISIVPQRGNQFLALGKKNENSFEEKQTKEDIDSNENKMDIDEIDEIPEFKGNNEVLYLFESNTLTPCASINIGHDSQESEKREACGITSINGSKGPVFIVLFPRAVFEVYEEKSINKKLSDEEIKLTNEMSQKLQSLFIIDPSKTETVKDNQALMNTESSDVLFASAVHSIPAPSRLISGFLRSALTAISSD